MKNKAFILIIALILPLLLCSCSKHSSAVDTSAAGKKAKDMAERIEKEKKLTPGALKPEQKSIGGMGKKVTQLKKEVFTTKDGVVIIHENTVINLTGSKYTDAETGISVGPAESSFSVLDIERGF